MAVSIKIVFGQKENMNKSPDPLLNICKYDIPLKINVENFYPEKKIFDNFTAINLKDIEFIDLQSNSLKSINIDGNSFIIDLDENNYFHFIEQISHFFLLKDFYKDLKIVVVANKKENIKLFISSFLNILDADILKIDRDLFNKIKFDNLFFINYSRNSLLYKSFMYAKYNSLEKNKIKEYDDILKNIYRSDPFKIGLKKIQDFINSKYQIKKTNKKIFISTKSINDRTRIYNDYLKIKLNEKNNFSKDYIDRVKFITKATAPGLSSLKKYTNERYISEEDENLILNYFIKNGYDVIDPTKMSIEEQIILYKQCSHIATLPGSSCIASAYCNKDTRFIIFNYNFKYKHPHKDYVNFILKDVISNSISNNEYDIKTLIKIFNESYGIYI